MIGYATVGSNHLERAKGFYDQVLAPLGGRRAFSNERMQGYVGPDGGMFAVCTPYDGKPASVGNGVMIALSAPSRELVEATHRAALASGGLCEGPPGLRGETFYGAYFRDLDGNKICVFNRG